MKKGVPVDLVYVLLIAVLLALSFGLIRLCEQIVEGGGIMVVIALILAIALLFYLIAALLKPEAFS